MQKTLWFFLTIFLMVPNNSHAYNFLYIHPTTGNPIGWGENATITYYLDPGAWNNLTNAQAKTLVEAAMRTWEAANPSAPRFVFGGYLPEDVDGTNYTQYVSQSSCYSSDINSCPTESQRSLQTVIIFDQSGDITDALCPINSCGAIADAGVFSGTSSNPGNIIQGRLVLGQFNGGFKGAINRWEGIIIHELGHMLGLAHTYLNQQKQFNGEVDQRNLLPTMYGDYVGESGAVLNPDDIAGISSLYPSISNSQNTGTIRGQILKSDNTPMMHVNVIARNINDPLCEAYSFLSGRLCLRPFGTVISAQCQDFDGNIVYDGNFLMSGLLEGHYTLEVEEVADLNLALTLAPGLVDPFIAGDSEFWNEGDQASETNTAFTTITLAAGETRDNINIVLNRSTVTDDRVKYIPLSTFTPGPATRCPSSPPVDYAAMIGIDEGTAGSGGGGGSSSGGCSLIQSE